MDIICFDTLSSRKVDKFDPGLPVLCISQKTDLQIKHAKLDYVPLYENAAKLALSKNKHNHVQRCLS